MKLSIVLPSIRPQNLRKLYDSVNESFHGEWEMVIVSPYDLPDNMKEPNVNLIKDWGNPVRAQQISLIAAKGEYISWAADDGYYLPYSLDIAMKTLEGKDKKTVIIGKYNEGPENPIMDEIEYYKIYTHEASRCDYIPRDCLMLMVGVVSRETLLELGGMDCRFEALPMAFNDFSIRLYNYGCTFIFQREMMFKCGHMPGIEGDHAPIHYAQVFHDTPVFKMIYKRPESANRTKIDIDNWKKVPEVWNRRFTKTT